jgi:hypothetical protein
MRGNCGTLYGLFWLLKACQLFQLYFSVFPFWEDHIFARAEEGIPQGLKPQSMDPIWRPKAKALGYLEAKATEAKATADPLRG